MPHQFSEGKVNLPYAPSFILPEDFLSFFFFPLIFLCGRAAARTITTATESGAKLLEIKDEKEHPLNSPPLCLGFLGQECSHMSSETTQL